MSESKQTTDVYAIITSQIIERLKTGTIPWRKPWSDAGPPMNLASKRPYRGINIWLLASLGYEQNFFLTFKQVQDIGGKVKRGEKGHLAVFWKVVNAPEKEHDNETGEIKQKPLLRYYYVYNIAQCEGIDKFIPASFSHDNTPLITCEKIVDSMPNCPKIQHKEAEAYYHPGLDYVNMPKLKTFTSSESYYATLFHELVHSTGHASRLNREGIQEMTYFGSTLYSNEEIIAELGTCFLTSHVGIAPLTFENNAAYIQAWIERLENDHRIIVYASMQAQKAVEYILGIKPEEIETAVVDEQGAVQTAT